MAHFDLYSVNPPLVKMLAAIPVLVAGAETDWSGYDSRPGRRPSWRIGQDFIKANGVRSFWLFTLARWACLPLSLLGAWVCWRWAGEWYGPRAGLWALALWCFSPNILANAALITPDLGAAALGAWAAYLFWKWLQRPDWFTAFMAGLAFGLMQLAKMTWLVAFPLWPVLWLLDRWTERKHPVANRRRREAGQLVLILGLGLYLINVGYGFSGSFTRLGEFPFVSETLSGAEQWEEVDGVGGNRFAGTWIGRIPVPLPRDYVLGLDLQKRDFEKQPWSYLAGEWRQGGWWYYYLYAAAVKVPVGTWILAGVAFLVWSRKAPARLRDELVLLAPAVAVFVLVSSQTGMNHHFRYVLPCFPFAFIWISQAARVFEGKRQETEGRGQKSEVRSQRSASGICIREWGLRAVVVAALAESVGSSLWVYPHSGSYFNLLAGGPKNGPKHLLSSNIDWGQDLLNLKRWYDAHPEARPFHLAYHGYVDPKIAGIEAERVPVGVTEPPPGWYAVSVQKLYDRGSSYAYFRRYQPVAMAGYSIYIYHITPEQVHITPEQVESD